MRSVQAAASQQAYVGNLVLKVHSSLNTDWVLWQVACVETLSYKTPLSEPCVTLSTVSLVHFRGFLLSLRREFQSWRLHRTERDRWDISTSKEHCSKFRGFKWKTLHAYSELSNIKIHCMSQTLEMCKIHFYNEHMHFIQPPFLNYNVYLRCQTYCNAWLICLSCLCAKEPIRNWRSLLKKKRKLTTFFLVQPLLYHSQSESVIFLCSGAS